MAGPRRTGRVLRNIRQAIPTNTVLGRRSPGDGPCEFIPLDEAQQADLDDVTATPGSILYRGANSWAGLPPGTEGQSLRMVSGLPSWSSAGGGGGAWTFQENISTTGGSQINIDVAGFSECKLVIKTLSCSSSGRGRVLFSPDDGTTVRDGATDYFLLFYAKSGSDTAAATSGPFIGRDNDAGAQQGIFYFMGLNEVTSTLFESNTSTTTGGGAFRNGWSNFEEVTETIILRATAGTFDAMDIDVYVR